MTRWRVSLGPGTLHGGATPLTVGTQWGEGAGGPPSQASRGCPMPSLIYASFVSSSRKGKRMGSLLLGAASETRGSLRARRRGRHDRTGRAVITAAGVCDLQGLPWLLAASASSSVPGFLPAGSERSFRMRHAGSKRCRSAHGHAEELGTGQASGLSFCSHVPLRTQKPTHGERQGGPTH